MALSFKPEDVPVVAVEEHLPAVDAVQLTPESLRRRFLQPPVWTPEIKVEHRHTERAFTHASVLIPMVLRDPLTVLFTQRTDHLTNHRGQVSFPGARVEPEDADA